VTNHLPTGILLKIFDDMSTPVSAPTGASNSEIPKLPSVKPNRSFIAGSAATQMPSNKLATLSKKPIVRPGLLLIKERMFFRMYKRVNTLIYTLA
jgi:hypothetical protein